MHPSFTSPSFTLRRWCAKVCQVASALAVCMASSAMASPINLTQANVVTGMHYSLDGPGAFLQVGITSGFGDLEIRLPDNTLLLLASNSTLDFRSYSLAPSEFDIIGLNIILSPGIYDPQLLFPTFLSWAPTTVTAQITPNLRDPISIPIAGTGWLVAGGICLLLLRRKAAPARRQLASA